MATENERSLLVDDFLGIDRQVNRDDVNQQGFHTLQNLYEKKIGELVCRPGSTEIIGEDDWPSNVKSINNLYKSHFRDFESSRIIGIECEPSDTQPIPDTTGFNATLINGGSGNWFSSPGGAKLGTDPEIDIGPYPKLTMQFVGFGECFNLDIGIDNYSIGFAGDLQITVPDISNSNITGINLYSYTVVDGRTTGLTKRWPQPIWFGYIDLVANPTGGVFTFTEAPRYFQLSDIVAATTFGATTPTFTLSGGTGGNLMPGRTYYVAVMGQRVTIDNDTIPGYGAKGVDDYEYAKWQAAGLTAINAIALSSEETAINIDNISGTSSAYAIAIGTHEDILEMQFITNSVNVTVNNIVRHTPNCVFVRKDSASSDWIFQMPDFSTRDMLAKIDDDGNISPIFVCNLSLINTSKDKIGSWTSPPGDIYAGAAPWYIGEGDEVRYAQIGDHVYFVNDAETVTVDYSPPGSSSAIAGAYSTSGLFMTDGTIASNVIYANGTTHPPKSKYIADYQNSLVIGGGSGSSASYNSFYISQALDPTDWSVSGGGADLNFVTPSTKGEAITGIGIYTNTTGTDGPISQLIVGTLNTSWALTNVPTATNTGNLINLSARIGFLGDTLVNTPVGTIGASHENVYLLRENGEPAPIGDAIEPIIRDADMSNARAIFQNNIYKLAFKADEDSTGNDTELWLDLKKFKATQGTPSWTGPHIGRTINWTISEHINELTENVVSVDAGNMRVFFGADESTTQDFSDNIVRILETKDYIMKPQGMTNKLLERWYWTARVMRPVSMTDQTTIDKGKKTETQTIVLSPDDTATWPQTAWDDEYFQDAWHLPYVFYPEDRLVGRSIRKKLTIDAEDNVGISELVINFKTEKRRI